MESGRAHRWRQGESSQRAPAGPLTFAAADDLFGRAERRIALLARVRPDNLRAANAAWVDALRRGARVAATWRYAPAPDLGDLRRALASAARLLPAVGALGRLYALRAEELELEAQLAENVGSPAFAELARRRHPERRGQEYDRAGQLAAAWATQPERQAEPRDLPPQHIAAHALLGHALPRLAARSHPLGLLPRELAWRHLAALWVAGGAGAHDCIDRLRQFGCELEHAVALYARVARGGGSCRELEYLPAWLRFARALHEDALLAGWLAHGRASLDAAPVLRDEGVPLGDGRDPILDLSLAGTRATRGCA